MVTRVCKTEESLQVHHLRPRSIGGTDKLSNLMTLCVECHRKHHQEGLRLPKQKSAFYVFTSHVQQGKKYLQAELGKIAPLQTTFGFITTYFRRKAGLEKSHINDAVMIANREAKLLTEYVRTNCVEFRKCSLHEATARKGRKEPNREQKRNAKNTFRLNGFQRWDTVKAFGKVGFISGFTGSNACRIVDINEEYISGNPTGRIITSICRKCSDCLRTRVGYRLMFVSHRKIVFPSRCQGKLIAGFLPRLKSLDSLRQFY